MTEPATAADRALAALAATYKGKRVALRIFVDGVAGEMPKDGQLIYAQVKTSDLASFLRHECRGVHPS